VYQQAIRNGDDITRQQSKDLAAKLRREAPPVDLVTLCRTFDESLAYVNLKFGHITNPSMLVMTKELVDLTQRYGDALYIDATHAMVDKGCQLVTFSLVIEGHGLRCAYGITRARTHDCYFELFRALRHMVGNENTVHHIVMDAEESLHSAARAIWPDADLHTCYFHYLQAIRKWFLSHRGHDQVHLPSPLPLPLPT
jgi:hypothetical protein